MRFIVLTLAICLGVFMQVLDSSIANVALPHIAGNLGVSVSESTWVITSFAAAQAIVLSITGWLAVRFAEHRVFAIATGLFGLASLFCGVSPSLGVLTLSRVIQGAVSGVLMPMSQSLLLQLWPEQKRASALGLWIMIALVGPVLGPVTGGWITEYGSWRWIFLINIPIAIVCTASILLLWEKPPGNKQHIALDQVGLGLLIVSVSSLQVCLDRGQEWDWWHSNTLRVLGIICLISTTYLLLWLKHSKTALIDLALISRRTVCIGTLFGVASTFIFYAPLTIFPIWLQQQLGYTPFAAGKVLTVTGILTIVLTPIAMVAMRRLGTLPIIAVGFLLTRIVFQWGSYFTAQTSLTIFVLNRLASGVGIALLFIPTVELVLHGLKGAQVTAAAGFFSFARYLFGLSCGTALMVTLYDRRTTYHRERMVANLIPERGPVNSALHILDDNTGVTETPWAILERAGTVQAATLAINEVFLICALLAYLMTAICLGAFLYNVCQHRVLKH